ncbi:hypothetical protein [Pseudomonas promysalinigenes]|jgi:hypothetical protein|uniref:Uncharacterized protein n=1 Tax=Pseudomonas promysalinigenes TaxID=485898 RepID=A0ABY6ART4_9PSED|nr:hypothetical protein [Pseudomonas promysalinigenes]UXH42028.1 hypothetical protein N5C08_11075 [Pseudomonas promysalinigenes]
MRHLPLLIMLLTPSLAIHALETQQAPPEQLHKLGSQLAAQAGNSQWQQLWQRTRAAGHLQATSGHAYFTVPHPLLPGLARQTLARADQVEALGNTLARYRRSFPDSVIGQLDGRPLNSLCLVIDWRTLPQSNASEPHAYLGSATLLKSYPCE